MKDQAVWEHIDDVLTNNERVMTRTLKNRVSAKRALNNQATVRENVRPATCERLGLKPVRTATVESAYAWLQDCFGDCPDSLTDHEIIAAINRHYSGGWIGFVSDGQA